jgi:hypothetical protein
VAKTFWGQDRIQNVADEVYDAEVENCFVFAPQAVCNNAAE